MKNEGGTRREMIETATRLVAAEGVCSISTRRIAEEAGVNVAALNYHFGTKEELIEKVLDRMLDMLFDEWTSILEIEEMSLPVRIYCLLDHTMESIMASPGMITSHLFDPLVDVGRRTVFAERLGSFLRKLPVQLEEHLPLQSKDIRLYLGQVMLLAVTAATVPELFRQIADEDIASGPARSRYLTGLMRKFLRIELKASDLIKSDIARVRKLAFHERKQ